MGLTAASAERAFSSPRRSPWAGRGGAPPFLFQALACAAALLFATPATASPILPAPAAERPSEGVFPLTARTVIAVPAGDPGALSSARYLADLLAHSRALKLKVVEGAAPEGAPAIVLRRGAPGGEAYRLDAAPAGLTIQSEGDAGLFYGAISAGQLAAAPPGKGPAAIPAIHIEDAPRFAWRGLMLDSARHFQSPGFVEAFIDRMARAKLNVLQWHLADDQGWRLEIRKYPRLTEVGAWRVPAGPAAAADIDPRTRRPRRVGGFYTQDQVREIVAYAAARHVTIVPEIEMPGHATAAIAAYPEFGAGPDRPAGPSSDWGVHTSLYNVDEKTFGFLEDVLTEVMELFPGRYIHVGGDEAAKAAWKADPAVQARMKALWIGDEDALQGWFVSRIERFLTQHGRRLVGWDEILAGGVSPGATVMSWRGLDGALVAAKLNHDTIVAAAPVYYFDNRQAGDPDQPPGRGKLVTLKDVYAYDPLPPGLTPLEQRHVLGVQGQVWSEHIRTDERMWTMAFPRALAIAETGWSPAARKDWAGFVIRAKAETARAAALGEPSGPAEIPPFLVPLSDRERTSQQLNLCSGKIALNLEDDAPVRGPRARFLVDITNPCWVWPGADLAGVRTLQVWVGQLPFNFQLGADRDKIRLRPPATPAGELEVRDGCAGALLATLPLAPALVSQGVTRLEAPIAAPAGRHDLCFTFTQKSLDPLWVVDRVRLEASPGGR
jgi:hexosaminidase